MKRIKSISRFIFVFLNNVYCIPVHVIWLIFLQPLHWVAENLYWKIESILFKWLLSMVASWSYSAGYHIVELGDDISNIINEKTVVLFNHQSTADVPLIMAAFHTHRGMLENIMWIMDRIFKRTNFGVVSIGHGDFFIRGGKENRDKSLRELSTHLKEFYTPRDRKWIVLFPEGGFLKNRKPVSQQFAKKNDLPTLENVSIPRVGALKVILDEIGPMKAQEERIKYIVDVTVAYPHGNPLDLLTLVTGSRKPCHVIFHYKIYPIDVVPLEEKALTNWVYNLYFKKETILQEYYDTGTFPSCEIDPRQVNKDFEEMRLYHDPLEFILRNFFFIASTYIWCRIIWSLCSYVWTLVL